MVVKETSYIVYTLSVTGSGSGQMEKEEKWLSSSDKIIDEDMRQLHEEFRSFRREVQNYQEENEDRMKKFCETMMGRALKVFK